MNPSRKKDLINAYKQRKVEGGIYCIRCTATGMRWIEGTTDLAGAQNRFHFAAQTNMCLHRVMQPDWDAHSAASFAFEVLESFAKKEDESMEDYREGLEMLRDYHRDGCPADSLYPM